MSGRGKIPREYSDYILAKEFGWTPSQVANEDLNMLELWREFLQLENNSENIKQQRVAQKNKSKGMRL